MATCKLLIDYVNSFVCNSMAAETREWRENLREQLFEQGYEY